MAKTLTKVIKNVGGGKHCLLVAGNTSLLKNTIIQSKETYQGRVLHGQNINKSNQKCGGG
jgi:hypothetical protein